MQSEPTKPKNQLHNPFAERAIQKIVRATKSQEELWIACKLGDDDANRAHNDGISLILDGPLDKAALDNALKELVQRHESLRAVFSTNGLYMCILDYKDVLVHSEDLSSLSLNDRNNAITKYLSNDANHVFDLNKGPLYKFGLLKLADSKHKLVITAHHLICDGWSFGVMLEELGMLYSASILKTTPDLPIVNSYSSYADVQHAYLGSDEHKTTLNFWLNQYKTIPQLNLPTDFTRPEIRSYNSEILYLKLPEELLKNIKKVGIQAGCTLVTTLLSSFEILLYKLTGQNDIALGLPSSGQSFTGKPQLIGHCVNILPLRSQIASDISFKEYLTQRKNALFDAYDHQQLSFSELLQNLRIQRDPSRVPLIPVLFNIDRGMTTNVAFQDLDFDLKSNPRVYEIFEIFLNLAGVGDEVILEWSYNTSLFSEASIKKMMATFEELLERVNENPEISISDIVKADLSIYENLNNTHEDYPDVPLSELIAQQAQATPDNTVLKFLDEEISYAEFDDRVNQLAHSLIEKSIQAQDFVGVCLPRSIELIITLNAILRCGAAYVPLDPSYPSQRLNYMLEDSGAKILISTEELASNFKTELSLLPFSDLFSNLSSYSVLPVKTKVSPKNIAYVLYTSGSTGKPKGVMITHRNLVNFLTSVKEKPGITASDRLLTITNFSFDMSVLDLYLPLISGATLVIAHEDISKDGRLLFDLLRKESITMMQGTPTTWQMILDSGWEDPLSIKAICGAEPWSLNLAQNLLPKISELWNMYGPTETTVWSARKQIKIDDEFISIGQPIANTQIYIMNDENQLMDSGQIGEIVIGGDGVSNGYWNREELTIDKFIDNPFDKSQNSKLYCTGDLGKLLPNGELQCVGRIDQQVKIRGHRIELGEIEQVLDAIEDIKSSVVVVNNDVLVAHIIRTDSNIQDSIAINIWKDVLKDQLPVYMVPHQFNLVDEFPTNLNGKIDRNALTKSILKKAITTDFHEASTNSEHIVAAIWQECLGIEKIDVNSDFFELGGHSLLGNKVMAILEQQTGNRVPLVALLKYSTIKELAGYLDQEFYNWDSLVPLKTTGTKPPLYVVHGANHNVLMFNELAQHLDEDQPLYGLQSRGLNGVDEPHDSIPEMAADYLSEIIASNPEGPYCIGGFSFGGIVAFEMAKQLKAQGREVKLLAQFDSYVFPQYYYKNPIKKKVVSSLYILGKIVYLLASMFTSSKQFKWRTQLIKLQIDGLFLRLKHGKKEQYEKQFNVPYKMLTSQNLAFSKYTIAPLDIVVDLFRAKEDIVFAHDPKYLGWKKMAIKGIRRHMIEGNHLDMFEKPNVKDFAKSLQYVLDNHDSEHYE
ncbi:MAG: amino acid adenylation domain-containing protein [Flavobacteriaceae bacterium]|nr:amino acid adenylation domain-containing protein [Flavobacteriaceae bacterium]